MKRFLLILALACVPASLFAQTPIGLGMNYPFVQPEFFGQDGSKPCASCLLYSYGAGTTTPLATYTDVNLSIPNTNPIVLNSAGRPAGSNGIFLLAQTYKFVLTTASGATIWTRDNVAVLPGSGGGGGQGGGSAHPCVTGADLAAKITNAYAQLPTSGGIIDCTNLTTAQTLGTDPFVGMTVPTTVIMPVVASTASLILNVPGNVTLLFPQGAFLLNGNTTNIAGRIDAGNWEIFGGVGQVCFGISKLCNVANGFTKVAVPQWWGALGNGVVLGTQTGTTGCNGTGGTNLISCAAAAFTSADIGKKFDLAHAGPSNCGQQYWAVGGSTFNCNLVGTISAVNSATQVVLSSNLSNTVSGEQFAYALPEEGYIQSAILSGVSQITVNGVFGWTSTVKLSMNNQSIIGSSGAASRFLIIGPVAYGTNKNSALVIDNGSTNVTFNSISFWGTNELGELNTFGPTPDALLVCTGIPNGLGGGCNSSSGITNIRVLNCDFSYTWGIGYQIPGTGTSAGQQVNQIYILNSTATYNSFDGFNPNPYDNLVVANVSSLHNGTGGLEAAIYGSISVTSSQFNFNKNVGFALGGFGDNISRTNSCQITGSDFSNNGNGNTTTTAGHGLLFGSGAQNCAITSNTLVHNHLVGLAVNSVPQDQNVTISGNTISSNGIVGASSSTIGLYGDFQNEIISSNFITDQATAPIGSATRTSNVVTVGTSTPHNYAPGYTVVISGTPGAWIDGTWTILTTADDRTFTFAQTAGNAGPTAGGLAYSAGSGFTQSYGIQINTSRYTQFLYNTVQNGHTRNVDLSNCNTSCFFTVFASNNNFPSTANTDLYLGSTVPSLTTLTVRIPDIQTTGNVCSTSGSAGAVCTTLITHNLGTTPNISKCVLDNTPNTQSGIPLLVKVDTSTSANTATVTIGALTAAVAGGGTMRCQTNYAY